MFRLSRYVEDPLRRSLIDWRHPITHSVVQLPPALLTRLPAILVQDLEEEADTPEQVLHQLLAAELSSRGFLIPASQSDREDAFLAEIAPLQRPEHSFFAVQTGENEVLPEDAAVAFVGAPSPSCRKEQRTLLHELRQLCRGERGSSWHSMTDSPPLDLSLVHDLGDLDGPAFTTASWLNRLENIVAQLPSRCVPLVIGDDASCVHALVRTAEPGTLVMFDAVWRVARESLAPGCSKLPPLSESNVLSHLGQNFPQVPVWSLGLAAYQALPSARGEVWRSLMERIGPHETQLACALMDPVELARRIPTGQKLVLGLNAEILTQTHGLAWPPAALLATLVTLCAEYDIVAMAVWGLEALTARLPPALVRTLLLTLAGGVLR